MTATTPLPEISIRAGHPDFLDLPWAEPITNWDVPHILDLPKGISRHEVRFLGYPEGIYALKELPERAATNDYQVLRALENVGAPAVAPVGLITGRRADPASEQSAALVTRYEDFSFSYRELVQGTGFGVRRNQLLNAFAELLVELHLTGCFWGDCSLSNVLYRYDAFAIETIMVDAETASLTDGGLSDGRRQEDVDIMIENVAGGMADVAAAAGKDLDEADLDLGMDIASRYQALWREVSTDVVIGREERYKIRERIARLNDLGFDVSDVDLEPVEEGSLVRVRLRVGGRSFHSNRLRELTGVDALENQARQILSDLHYFQARYGDATPTGKSLGAVRWRLERFEPYLRRLEDLGGVTDPVQAYTDLLHHRYIMASGVGQDVDTEVAFQDWLERGRPGYPTE